jgi:hypothetical protein
MGLADVDLKGNGKMEWKKTRAKEKGEMVREWSPPCG